MKFLLVLFIIGLPLRAFATTKSEKSDFDKDLKEIFAEVLRIQSEMGPCEGLDRLSKIADKVNPPASCLKAKKFFDSFQKNERVLQKTCRKLNSYAELHFRKQDFCASENAQKKTSAAKVEISNIKRKVSEGFEGDEFPGITFADISDDDYSKWKGEFSRIECAKPVLVGMQMGKLEFRFLNYYFGVLEIAADSIEDKSCRVHVENIFLYQRGGKKALKPVDSDTQ